MLMCMGAVRANCQMMPGLRWGGRFSGLGCSINPKSKTLIPKSLAGVCLQAAPPRLRPAASST